MGEPSLGVQDPFMEREKRERERERESKNFELISMYFFY